MLVLHLVYRWLLPLPSVQITSYHLQYFLSMHRTGGSLPAQMRFSIFLVVISHRRLPSSAESDVALVCFNVSCRFWSLYHAVGFPLVQRSSGLCPFQCFLSSYHTGNCFTASFPKCRSPVVFLHFNIRRPIVVSICSLRRQTCTRLRKPWEIESLARTFLLLPVSVRPKIAHHTASCCASTCATSSPRCTPPMSEYTTCRTRTRLV